MPWRREAAELAVAIGREIQALNAEGDYYSNRQDKFVYEAVLWAAPELPDDVAQLCLELAQRRDLDPEIRERVAQTHTRKREERRQWLAAHPERKRAPSPPPSWPKGDLRDPWPDGPRSRIHTDFQDACLDTGAFSALARANPDAALEVLLAVCIEDAQRGVVMKATPATAKRPPKPGSLIARMSAKLSRAGHRSRYRWRKQVVEPVFGQIKQARGFRQFLLRGIEKVRAEWALICTAHNLTKLAAVE